MDKRSFIAVALTFAILIGWQMLYVAPRQREAAQRRMMEQRERALNSSRRHIRLAQRLQALTRQLG